MRYVPLPSRLHREGCFGSAFEQHPHGLALKLVSRLEHQTRDDERRDGVRAIEAGDENHDSGDERADERIEIGHDVLKASLDVQAFTVRFRKNPRSSEIHDDAQSCDDRDQPARDLGRIDESRNPFVRHEHAQHEQNGAIGLPAEHLCAPHSVCQPSTNRTLHEPNDDEREHERPGIGQHVPGVRQQRQRMRDDPGHDLKGHESDDQHERDRQVAPIGIDTEAMRMIVTVVVTLISGVVVRFLR